MLGMPKMSRRITVIIKCILCYEAVQLMWHRSVQFFLLFIHFLNVQQMSWFVIIPPFVFSSGVEITDVNDKMLPCDAHIQNHETVTTQIIVKIKTFDTKTWFYLSEIGEKKSMTLLPMMNEVSSLLETRQILRFSLKIITRKILQFCCLHLQFW